MLSKDLVLKSDLKIKFISEIPSLEYFYSKLSEGLPFYSTLKFNGSFDTQFKLNGYSLIFSYSNNAPNYNTIHDKETILTGLFIPVYKGSNFYEVNFIGSINGNGYPGGSGVITISIDKTTNSARFDGITGLYHSNQ